jgi:hypothetical protein
VSQNPCFSCRFTSILDDYPAVLQAFWLSLGALSATTVITGCWGACVSKINGFPVVLQALWL